MPSWAKAAPLPHVARSGDDGFWPKLTHPSKSMTVKWPVLGSHTQFDHCGLPWPQCARVCSASIASTQALGSMKHLHNTFEICTGCPAPSHMPAHSKLNHSSNWCTHGGGHVPQPWLTPTLACRCLAAAASGSACVHQSNNVAHIPKMLINAVHFCVMVLMLLLINTLHPPNGMLKLLEWYWCIIH